ncbi:MAG TPA: iron-siderophore ABC transporter substrate-binding protein [Nocardioidaceae bacterium]|nr:iron-siderophore ABC transporter substrate-binding protein [Nocardioidaceae bacterium]
MRHTKYFGLATSVAAALFLAGCGDTPEAESPKTTESTADQFPVTIEHVYGETVIAEKPERIATVAWANHEVPLALGVVPVGMSEAAWGDDDGDGVLPWVEEQLEELDAETPVLFDEADGIDFEWVADTQPDVILASYSGLTQDEYDTLSKIAPVVAYPDVAWGTSMQDMIRLNSQAMGMADEGDALIAELEQYIGEAVATHPELVDAQVLFSYLDTNDLSQIGFYTTNDTRPGFLAEIGMATPKVVSDASAGSGEFYTTISSEKGDQLADVDLVITYGATDGSTLKAIQADKLLAKIPAIAGGAVAVLPDATPLAASANPSPLSIRATLEDYLDLLAAAIAGA